MQISSPALTAHNDTNATAATPEVGADPVVQGAYPDAAATLCT